MPHQDDHIDSDVRYQASPSVQEIVSANPGYMVRNGTVIILAIILLLFACSWMIRYPDTLEGSASITTDPLPIKMKSNMGGRVTQLFVQDGAAVAKNTPIAEMENATGYANIFRMEQTIDSINLYLATNNEFALESLISKPMQSLGDAQPFYNELLQQLSARSLLNREQIYDRRTRNLEEQNSNLRSIARVSKQESAMIEEALQQANEQFEAHEQLYIDRVISRQEYYAESEKLRTKQLQLEQLKRNGIQDNISAGDNSKQMLEIHFERKERERALMVGVQEALRNINNYIQAWKQRYLIVAPYKGTLQYLRPLQINESTTAGAELFAVVPVKSRYLAVIMMPANGIGKIAMGQKVHLHLANFPYNEFGFLEGKVVRCSLLPEIMKSNTDGQFQQGTLYRVYVQLPDTLITSCHKKIPFSPEMAATARVITKDRNLLQRLIAGAAQIDN